MISSLLMTGTEAPRDALPDARGLLSFPLSSSHTQPRLLIPPSVQSNDCPLHAPCHPILPIFLRCCGFIRLLKHGVRHSGRTHNAVCCKAATALSTQHVIVMNVYSKYWEVLFSLGYWVSQQISYVPEFPSSRATMEVRGQIKEVSWRWTRLPPDFVPPNGIKSLLTAMSSHTEWQPSLVSYKYR